MRLYVFATVAAACGFALWSFATHGSPNWHQLAFFWTLHALTKLDRIEVPIQRMSLVTPERRRGVTLSSGFIILMTAVYATDLSTSIAIALVPPLLLLIRKDARDATKLLFNSGQATLYVGMASLFFLAARGTNGHVLMSFGAATGAAVIALSLNTALVAGVVALERGMTLAEIVRRMTWTIPHSIGFAVIALMVATLYVEFGAVAAVSLFMPLAAMRFARHAKVSLDAAREQTLTEFVRTVEAKDPYTYRHSERVAAICVELHRELGAKPAYLERRWMAALLHDVGKVAVPAEVLLKPGSLTDEEFELIKLHPGLGADVVDSINSLRDLVPEIRHHHERMDGAGYPAGLAGDAIPYEARILAVADAFEALTSDRPYRDALSSEEALDVLWKSAGEQHDRTGIAALNAILARGVSFVRPNGPRHARETEPMRAAR